METPRHTNIKSFRRKLKQQRPGLCGGLRATQGARRVCEAMPSCFHTEEERQKDQSNNVIQDVPCDSFLVSTRPMRLEPNSL